VEVSNSQEKHFGSHNKLKKKAERRILNNGHDSASCCLGWLECKFSADSAYQHTHEQYSAQHHRIVENQRRAQPNTVSRANDTQSQNEARDQG
jgi:hypothetical protein